MINPLITLLELRSDQDRALVEWVKQQQETMDSMVELAKAQAGITQKLVDRVLSLEKEIEQIKALSQEGEA